MELTQYVESLRRELTTAAEVGGEAARALADRLLAPLDAAVRLTLLEALSTAADEISAELAPGSVDVRLRGGNAAFVVTPPPAEAAPASGAGESAPGPLIGVSDSELVPGRAALRHIRHPVEIRPDRVPGRCVSGTSSNLNLSRDS